MKSVVPSGVVMMGVCDIQTPRCIAKEPAPLTVVFEQGRQLGVCKPCLEEQIRGGEWEIKESRVRRRADVAIRDKDGLLVAVIEIKRADERHRADPMSWAKSVLNQLLVYNAIPQARFLILIGFPDMLFLWTQESTCGGDREPFASVDIRDALSAFSTEEAKDNFSMDRVVARWFAEVISHPLAAGSALNDFEKSGFLEAVRGCSVVQQYTVS